jgi:hypothetical protein
MSRKILDYASNVFTLLAEGLRVPDIAKMRIRPPQEHSAFMQEFQLFLRTSKLEVDYILNNVKVAKFTYNNSEHLLITQIDPNESETKSVSSNLESMGVIEQDINAALFILLVKDANLQRMSPLSLPELEDNIFYGQYGVDYRGHDFTDLMNYIEKFTVFRIDSNSAFSGRDGPEIGYYICSQFDKFVTLPIQPLVTDYQEILQEQSAVLKENVFLSLTATHYKHSFIELYRCIEVLYVLPRSINLKAKLAYSNPAYELARHCIDELGWRKREEDSLCRILKDINESVIAGSGIQKATFADPEWLFNGTDSEKKSHEKLAVKIYRIRNQLVHQLLPDDEIDIADQDWNLLIKFTLDVIKDAYRVYKSDLPPAFA